MQQRAGRGISHIICAATSPTRANKFWPSGIGVARTESAAAPPCRTGARRVETTDSTGVWELVFSVGGAAKVAGSGEAARPLDDEYTAEPL
jgi:hypothetical protein